jgi:hypothetical protein
MPRRPAADRTGSAEVSTAGRYSEESLDVIRQILLSPPERTNAKVAQDHGVSREWVRRIRRGISAAEFYPELPRFLPASQRQCTHCEHFVFREYRVNGARRKGHCGLGHQEPDEIGPRFGVGCGAFMPQKVRSG